MKPFKNTLLFFVIPFVTSASAALTGKWTFDTLDDSVTSTAGATCRHSGAQCADPFGRWPGLDRDG
jgi:hypothetical protein